MITQWNAQARAKEIAAQAATDVEKFRASVFAGAMTDVAAASIIETAILNFAAEAIADIEEQLREVDRRNEERETEKLYGPLETPEVRGNQEAPDPQ